MFRQLLNECLISLQIITEGPVLVKSGMPGLEGPDMSPVLTQRGRTQPEPYLPGSSLKGVLRSHAERIARTLAQATAEGVGCCNPFKRDEAQLDGACSDKFDKRAKPPHNETIDARKAYRDACPICKLFGCTSLAGRFSIQDAYLAPDAPFPVMERRDGVGIDRLTGGSSRGAKFELQVVTKATFHTEIKVTNFELWQIGLLAYVLNDFQEGMIFVGSGKSRGLGKVRGVTNWMELRYLSNANGNTLHGVIDLVSVNEYDFWEGERGGVPIPEGVTRESDALKLRLRYRFDTPEKIVALWQAAAPLWNQMLNAYRVPDSMRFSAQQGGR